MPFCRHLIRIGKLGHVGHFDAVDGTCYPRGIRVICRTVRGLEVGEVLAPSSTGEEGMTETMPGDGTLLRAMTTEDELLWARMIGRQEEAFTACAQRVAEREPGSVLVDVEHLFDGSSVYFYFLGQVTPAVEALTAELAEIYDAQVQFRQFSETLQAGCGPDCGTESAAGCGQGGCASCAVAAACGTRRTGS
jgi:cell fate regulator YaaT (PSP1 superfamily)